ncbi:MAG TPA: hypothetical protein VFQ65_20845 [Kofleriaceae bacterium]|nr:hypothetical protein [Kofleriaceae bacterium]
MRFARWAPFPIAFLVVAAASAGIFVPAIYARETASWAAQGSGQDWVDLVIAGPALVIAALCSLGGDRRARLVTAGLLLYTSYSFAIYAFAVHFNALFLVYCAVLGGSTFALTATTSELLADAPATWFGANAPVKTTAVTLYAIAGLFGMLWLAQLVPALLLGRDPAGLADTGLVVNPVHVLDLALVLPAMVVVATALRRGHPLGIVFAPILLVFGVMMAIAIAGMVLAMNMRGLALDPVPTIAMAIVATACAVVVTALLRRLHR